MDTSDLDLFRIVIVTIVSMVTLFLFKRRIKKIITDLVIGSDTSEYQDVTVPEMRDRIESRMDEVLKWPRST